MAHADGTVLFTQTAGYRPQGRHLFMVMSIDAVGRTDILSNGQVQILISNSAWVNLSCIAFPRPCRK
jgi:hypothetical protein